LLLPCLGFFKEVPKLCRFRLNQYIKNGFQQQPGKFCACPSTETPVSAFMETIFNILTGTIPKWVSFEQDSCLISQFHEEEYWNNL
jgi:hypothetical protein